MFESWVADVLANALGRYLDVQKDKLRISLWSGECARAPGRSCVRMRGCHPGLMGARPPHPSVNARRSRRAGERPPAS